MRKARLLNKAISSRFQPLAHIKKAVLFIAVLPPELTLVVLLMSLVVLYGR